MTFYLISLGCQMNISDSERVKSMLMSMGYEETTDESKANIVGVMACSVRQKAIDKVYSLIHKWEQWKKSKSLITFISGCILPADREKFLKRFDLLFSINELPHIPEMFKQYGVLTAFNASPSMPAEEKSSSPNSTLDNTLKNTSNPHISHTDSSPTTFTPTNAHAPQDNPYNIAKGFWKIAPHYSSAYDAYVTIQNGCDKFCTFCAVPYTRGREVSRASSEILQEVHTLMEKGYTSITLLGQNVNSYGLDTNGVELTFAQLLARVGNMAEELHHKCWVYFTSPHPRDMNNDVLEAIAQYPALANQINLPLQSGDDKLLMRMNRNHSMTRYRQVVTNIREIVPEATLFTDIIVGFCGETEEQFQNTIHAMEEFQYNMAYIAMYSPRPGAASSRWKDSVPHEIKKQRYHRLSHILKQTAQSYNHLLIGNTITLLIEDIQTTHNTLLLKGRNEGKIPVQISIPLEQIENPELLPNSMTHIIGTFIDAKVTGTHSLSLECSIDNLAVLYPSIPTGPHLANLHTTPTQEIST